MDTYESDTQPCLIIYSSGQPFPFPVYLFFMPPFLIVLRLENHPALSLIPT